MRIGAAPIACKILDFFDRWHPPEALFCHFEQYSSSSLRKAVHLLAKYSLLERSDRKKNLTERAMQSWARWNPAAGFLHFSTKDVHYATDPTAVARLLRLRAKKWPIPTPVKHYPTAAQVRLPAPKTDSEFPRVLLARRTWRQFLPRPLELSALGTLLGLTWGVQRWVPIPRLGRVALKTSPSGGALHPIEVYVLARRVEGLPPGLYHYAADRHRLELLSPGATSRQLASYLPGQRWYGSAAALMLMTAVFPRSQWKYQFPRAYRAVLMEAGHLCQTFYLVATWLNLAPFCTLALADTRVEKDLGLDGVRESVLYAAGVGARPASLDWAPTPAVRHASSNRE